MRYSLTLNKPMTESTQNLLVAYAYCETKTYETVEAQHHIDSDPLIKSEFEELLSLIQKLDLLKCNPSDRSIESILSHA